jgi:hypothetical protein
VANKRNKSRKQQRARRQGGPAPRLIQPTAGGPVGGGTESEAAEAASRPQPSAAPSRYTSAVSGPRRGGAAAATVGTIDIDERVPYFAKDLRRIVMTAAVMVVIIVGASFLLH